MFCQAKHQFFYYALQYGLIRCYIWFNRDLMLWCWLLITLRCACPTIPPFLQFRPIAIKAYRKCQAIDVSTYPLKRRSSISSIDIMRWRAISPCARNVFSALYTIPRAWRFKFSYATRALAVVFRRVDASGKFLAATGNHCIHVLWFSYPVILHLNRLLFTWPPMFFCRHVTDFFTAVERFINLQAIIIPFVRRGKCGNVATCDARRE